MSRTPSATLPLAGIGSSLAGDARELAFGREPPGWSANAVAGRVAGLTHALRATGSGRWIVTCQDPLAVAVACLAAGGAGCVAVLAANRSPGALAQLARGAVGVLVDLGAQERALAELPQLAPLEQRSERAPFVPLDRDAELVEVHTSGTTGAGRPIVKRLRHLDDEVAALEASFGARLGPDARIFATVSPLHIYGLLFRVLWPLASGRPFSTDTPLHPRELLPLLRGAGACALVSSPAHLKQSSAVADFADAADACRAVFSSGGPLEAEVAQRVARALGEAPLEILGSTETGGVAWRQRDDETWTAFPEVRIAVDDDERLVVSSPFVSSGEETDAGQRFTMGDRAKLLGGGRFGLQPRADRTVKIGEKRLALPAMERELAAHHSVEEAALVVLPRGAELRVHAVLVLSEQGRALVRRRGRRELAARLTGVLARSFDPVTLPRAWRIVAALPRDAQGKLPHAALAALFARRDPEVTEEGRAPDAIARRLQVPDDLACLEGHFPGLAVVPGVAQIRWVLDAAEELLGAPPRVAGFDALKFPAPLRPGDGARLRVSLAASRDLLRFELAEGERVFASGRCLLREPVEPA